MLFLSHLQRPRGDDTDREISEVLDGAFVHGVYRADFAGNAASVDAFRTCFHRGGSGEIFSSVSADPPDRFQKQRHSVEPQD